MLESFKNLKTGNIDQVDNNKLFPLLRWSSGSVKDLSWCNIVNKYMFFVDKEIIKGLLYIGLQDNNPYIKYPKATKEKVDKVFELKKTLAKKYYSWSEQEFNRNISMVDFIDWNEVALALGCDKKERKLLGLKEIKVTKKPLACKKSSKTLFDF